jgi:hypothetical protein
MGQGGNFCRKRTLHRELALLPMFSLILSWFYIDMMGEIAYYEIFSEIC